jgi:hypothetical protein
MRCEHCDGDFEPKTSRRRFCSARCRKAAWQQKRKDDLAAVEGQLARALTRLRALRGLKGTA